MQAIKLILLFGQRRSDYYVDSVAGSDANVGTSEHAPFRTIAAVNAAVVARPTKKRIALKRGSYWREQLGDLGGGPNALPAGTVITGYGTGPLPVLDGASVAVNANFSLTPAQANTYQITWAHSLGAYSGKEFFTVWENGARLTRKTSIANCEAAAGSFYAPDPSGASGTIYVHPTGETNPASDGKTYEITKRLYGIGLPNVDNCSVANVRMRRGGQNNGSLEMGKNATIAGVIAQEGRLHNILLGSGVATDSTSWKLELGAGGTGWVAFSQTATGLSVSFTRCYHIGDTGNVSSVGDENGFYAHGTGTQHGSLSFTDCYAYYCATGINGLADAASVIRCGIEKCGIHIATGATSLVVDDCYLKGYDAAGFGSAVRMIDPDGAAGSITNTRLEGMKTSGGIAAIYIDGVWEVSHCTFYNSDNVGSYAAIQNTGALTVSAHHNIGYNFHNFLVSSSGLTLGTWDNNVYRDTTNVTYPFFTLNGNAYGGLTNWKTGSGKETSSIWSDPLFAGSPPSGDWTVQAGSPAVTLGAGATADPTKARWAMPVWADVLANLAAA